MAAEATGSDDGRKSKTEPSVGGGTDKAEPTAAGSSTNASSTPSVSSATEKPGEKTEEKEKDKGTSTNGVFQVS